MRSKHTRTWIQSAVFLLLAWASMLTPAFASPNSKSGCMPEFPLDAGWQGADAAYSIQLPDKRDIWIFGDTLYGPVRGVLHGSDPLMVRNSIQNADISGGIPRVLEQIQGRIR